VEHWDNLQEKPSAPNPSGRTMTDGAVEVRELDNGSIAATGSFNYNAAKAAVVMMSKSGALELAAHGIWVVGIAPGFMNTPILGKDEAMKSALSKLHMHGQLIEPERVASVVAFLFTGAAQAINGATVPVDDGFLAFK